MLRARAIPTLLLKDGGLVKGQKFEKHRYVGDPINAVRIFNTKEVDELVFLDIDAGKKGQEPNYDLLKDIASEAFMPLGYGGGVRHLSHIENLFRIGVEKVIINTAAIDLDFIAQASTIAGSQSIVVSVDVRKEIFGAYQVYTQSGSHGMKIDPVSFAKNVEQAGAGEIILCSINREGSGKGYDLNLISAVSHAVNIPVVASGGAKNLKDMFDAVQAGASAAAAGSMFVFHGKRRAVLITYPDAELLNRTFKGLS